MTAYSIASQTNMLFKAITIDERVVKAFKDQFLIDKLWELLVSRVAGLGCNLRYYGVPKEVTERIDRMILEPDKLKEELK